MSHPGQDNPEFMPPSAMRHLQTQLLQEHLAFCAAHSPYYQDVFARHGVRPETLTLDNLTDIPCTTKADLERHNDAFLAVPAERIVDIVLSSGTTGEPTRIMYTEADLQRLAYNEQQSFLGTGLGADDIVLLTCTMDRCFIAGLAYFLGIRALGGAMIRNGHGTMEGHLHILKRMRPTAIIGVPSFLRKLGEYVKATGVDPAASPVKRLICIGEPVRDRNLAPLKVERDLVALWNADVFSTYASSETVTSFCECTARQGGHLHPDLAIVEVVDESGGPLPPGEVGEVVVTPLAVEGMPLIRFQTGDLSFLIDAPCACGRLAPRLGPILGRRKQMLKLKGTTFYPQAIGNALESIPELLEHYVEVEAEDTLSDRVLVHVSVAGDAWDAARVAAHLQARLRVKPDVILEPVDVIRRQVYCPESRKPIRFIDRRQA